jgi:hypothetical protein
MANGSALQRQDRSCTSSNEKRICKTKLWSRKLKSKFRKSSRWIDFKMNLIKLKRNELKCSWSLLDRVNNLSTSLEQEIIFFKDSEAKLFQKLKHAKAEKAQMPKDNKALEQQLEEYILEVRSMDTFKANLLNLYKIELKCFLSLSELLLSKYCSYKQENISSKDAQAKLLDRK